MAGDDDNQQNEQQAAFIQRVGLKIPPFWEESPDIWFAQIEAQFANAQVTTDISKFNAVVGAIESKILTQVSSAVLNPPTNDKYKNLKDKIIETFSESEHKKMSKLLENIALGDQKPSMLLNEMRRLSSTEMTDDLLKTLWLKRLPTQARVMLSTNSAELSELAKIADKVVEIGNLNSVNGISTSNQQTDALQTCILQLTKAIESLQRSNGNDNPRSFSRSRSKSRSRSQNRSENPSSTKSSKPSKSKKQYDICWYHYTFGSKADKCDGNKEVPCNFSKN